MTRAGNGPKVFHVLRGEALELTKTPHGSVGLLFSGEGIEVVWVSKEDEEIDPGWFEQTRVDLILVVAGQLRFEFDHPDVPPRTLDPGDFLVLPANTRCRAYRWPRERRDATVFVAFYPSNRAPRGERRT